jgi:hypothetical protein
MSRDSKNLAVSCPKCKNSQKKKLAIRLDDDRVHCWVCGLGGRLISILVQYRPSLVHEYVTRFVGSNVTLLKHDPIEKQVVLPADYRLLAPLMGSNEPTIKWAVNYLKHRGLTERDLWYFKFGVSTDTTMRRRVIMPSFDGEGILNFYTGRAIDSGTFRKYMNCDTEKKAVIFNEINLDWSRELTLVEGPFDLTKCDENATCLLGSSFTEDSALFSMVFKHMTPIVLALDCDMVNKTWQRIARMLSNYDIPVKILDLGSFKDVGEMTKKQFLDAKASARGWDRMDALRMKINTLDR